MKRMTALLVVADGATARVYLWTDLSSDPTELEQARMQAPDPPEERGPSPRVHDSMGVHRHRVERRYSAHEAAERAFLIDVAAAIKTLVARLNPNLLILCAPPRGLGVLRKALEKADLAVDVFTITKDLVKETPRQLAERLRRMDGLPSH